MRSQLVDAEVVEPPREPGRPVGDARRTALVVTPSWLARLLILGGAIGLACSSILLVEKVAVLEDPTYVPSCSINPVLSCGSVMTSTQAEAFGFPNPILGLVGFSIVLTVGMAVSAGASMRSWFWLAIQAGTVFGVVFVHWLIFQSLYRIGALCPYCMVVWAVTIPLFWYLTLFNLRRLAPDRSLVDWVWNLHAPILTLWFVAIGVAITVRFWDYWSTLL